MDKVRIRWIGMLAIVLAFLNARRYFGISHDLTVISLGTLLGCLGTSSVGMLATIPAVQRQLLSEMRSWKYTLLVMLCCWTTAVILFTVGARPLLWFCGVELPMIDQATPVYLLTMLVGSVLWYPLVFDE
jgi:hypothetical protein